jgi:DNA-binding MarR family transcriptional regulator
VKNKEKPLLSTLIKRCGRAIDRDIDRMLKQHGIARSQYRVLYYMVHYDDPPQAKLMNIMEVQASTLTLIIDVLVQKGWLVRIKDMQDKRQNKLHLTREGEKIFKQIPDPNQRLQEQIIKTLSKEEAKNLGVAMKKIIKELSSKGLA